MKETLILATKTGKRVKRECPVCQGHSLVANKHGDTFNCKTCGNVINRDDLPEVTL